MVPATDRRARLTGIAVWGLVMALAIVVGVSVSRGGRGAILAGLIATVALAAAVVLRVRIPSRPGLLAVEVPTVLLGLSSLVFRMRDTTSLSTNPLDAAGLFRLACIGAAALLCVMALLQSDIKGGLASLRKARPLWLYAAYIVVICLGITKSVYPLLTAFHAVNIVVSILVVLTAYLTMGDEGLQRLEKTIFWFIVAHVASAWLGAILFPGEALRAASPFPFRIEGVMPALASDRLGEYGSVLFFWAYASRNGLLRDRVVSSYRIAFGLECFGIVSLLAAQYRTGYIAFGVGLLVLLALHGRVVLASAIAFSGFVVVRYGQTLFAPLFAFVLRGQGINVATSLSGRTNLWAAAIPIWKQSPLIGGGIETASRFLVLDSLGRGYTGSVHGTWIEALVGTGLIGLSLLAATVGLCLYRGYLQAVRGGRLAPILVLSVLAVRSVTGSSFETFGMESMLFMAMLMAVRSPQPFHEPGPDIVPRDPYEGLPAPGGVPAPGGLSPRSPERAMT
jgi:O-antigen ligase